MSHQPAQRRPDSVRTKILKFGCLPVIVLFAALIGLGMALDDGDDKTDSKPSTTPSARTEASPKPADHSKLDDAAKLACDDFAHGYKAAQTQQARIDLADKVNKWASQSTTDGIADNAVALARGSEASAGAWQLGADAFAQSCLDAGWDA
ncbi:hypothetical protein GCM10010330_57020 [Streptomyces tendae]|uniref:hypothetical protein n=1 Tax=Streptomyces tendae TaxID=1932 RepID=UPI00167C19A3|nr:hypothetical protein [Streptomyces tendae]GHA95456.1 hypothetical protein GCM10010330_57020 [Streptomyces tendae]